MSYVWCVHMLFLHWRHHLCYYVTSQRGIKDKTMVWYQCRCVDLKSVLDLIQNIKRLGA